MTFFRLVLRNLLFHWRGNGAVLLGVAVGTAVLTGALLVGDSLRGSLADQTRQRLAWVDQALVANHFLRAELADSSRLPAQQVCGAIIVRGAVSVPPREGSAAGLERRAGHVNILGVDRRFWQGATFPEGVAVNGSLARDLSLDVGEPITIHLQRASQVPRESLLGSRETADVVAKVTLPLASILDSGSPGNRFELHPGPEAPRNVFVPLDRLQDLLEQPGRINAVLVGGAAPDLQDRLRANLTLDDWGLTLHTPTTRTKDLFARLDRDRDGRIERREWRDRVAQSQAQAIDADKDGTLTQDEVSAFYRSRPYFALESRTLLLEPPVAEAALEAAKEGGLRMAPTLIYLANRIRVGDQSVPYSVVAALDPGLDAPLGPFFRDSAAPLKDDEIVLVDWPRSPLHARPGDAVELTYFPPEEVGQFEEKTARFTVRAVAPLEGPRNDPQLTPEFPGITDKPDLGSWKAPFPIDFKRITPADDAYWKEFRTTPKAYITLARGQHLWASRFGSLTSLRLAADADRVDDAAGRFDQALLKRLHPEQGGLVFDEVRQNALAASVGGTDFGEYFLAFSFFLIVSSLLLVGLLFRLNVERRAPEIGLLLATGFRKSRVRWLLLAEGAALAVVGGVLGLVVAWGYALLLIALFKRLWPVAGEASFLRLHGTPVSLFAGYLAAVVMCILTIVWAVRVLGRVTPPALLMGETTPPETASDQPRRRWSIIAAVACLVLAVAAIVAGGVAKDHEAKAGSFFSGGSLLLIAGLTALWAWMKGRRDRAASFGLPALAVRNAARNPLRSLLTAGLLATAAFLLVAVESFRRDAGSDFLDKKSGSGGFALLGETDVPIFQDLNSDKARAALHDELQRRTRDQFSEEAVRARELAGREATLRQLSFFPFRVKAGDDASCLNLYQPRQPRLLGVPRTLVDWNGFHFAETEAKADDTRTNPWLLLEQPAADGDVPVFGEANTVTYVLKSKLGGTIPVLDDRGKERRLRVVGLLEDSVFQSGLLMSDANLRELFPSQQGYNFFLIDTGSAEPADAKAVLETALADQGFEATPTRQRLESYLAVEGTYLSTFQALGALGLLLGVVGLAVVLLRGVWERRGELALLRALGYQRRTVGGLVLGENAFLLLYGLMAGTLAALLAVLPTLLGGGGQVPVVRLVLLLGAVLAAGLGAGFVALRLALRQPLIPALRRG